MPPVMDPTFPAWSAREEACAREQIAAQQANLALGGAHAAPDSLVRQALVQAEDSLTEILARRSRVLSWEPARRE